MQLQMARLMELHKLTDPKRIGAFFGVTPQWARRLWNRFTREEMREVSEEEVFGILVQIRHGETQSIHTQRAAFEGFRAAGAAVSDRGPEPCPQCAGPGVTTRHAGRKV